MASKTPVETVPQMVVLKPVLQDKEVMPLNPVVVDKLPAAGAAAGRVAAVATPMAAVAAVQAMSTPTLPLT